MLTNSGSSRLNGEKHDTQSMFAAYESARQKQQQQHHQQDHTSMNPLVGHQHQSPAITMNFIHQAAQQHLQLQLAAAAAAAAAATTEAASKASHISPANMSAGSSSAQTANVVLSTATTTL